jgi:hypothetical protein
MKSIGQVVGRMEVVRRHPPLMMPVLLKSAVRLNHESHRFIAVRSASGSSGDNIFTRLQAGDGIERRGKGDADIYRRG